MLIVPPAEVNLIDPPGPGAAASSKARSWALLVTLMATPLVALLLILMVPPLALRRRFPSLEETSIVFFRVIVFCAVRLTVPPIPPVIALLLFRPVVAEIGALIVRLLPVTSSWPPLPPAS